MTSIKTFRSARSLLISYVDVEDQISITSMTPNSLRSETVKTTVSKNIRFSAYNGKLFVNFTEKNGDSPSLRQRFEPHCPGILLRFLHPKDISLIESFLLENFGAVEVKELTRLEKDYLSELRFFNQQVKEEQKEVLANLLIKVITLCFPVYINYIDNRVSDGFYSSFGFNAYGRKHFRSTDFKDFIIEVFGCYRKDVAKVALKCNAATLDWVSRFKGLIPVDYIVNALHEDCHMIDGVSGSLDPIRDFPIATIHKLFLDGLHNKDFDSITVNDALEMSSSVPIAERKLCRTWKELHDRGVMHYVHDENGYKEISHPHIFEEFFENADFGARKVVPLRNSEEFIKTGKYMDVCVGSLSYITRAFEGDGYCFRVDNENKEKYALIEVLRNQKDEWKINQVRGNSNANLPEDFHKELFEQLSKYIPLESRT